MFHDDFSAFLHTHFWLNWVDEDDDEVGLKEVPEDTTYLIKYYIKIRPEAPGVWASLGLRIQEKTQMRQA